MTLAIFRVKEHRPSEQILGQRMLHLVRNTSHTKSRYLDHPTRHFIEAEQRLPTLGHLRHTTRGFCCNQTNMLRDICWEVVIASNTTLQCPLAEVTSTLYSLPKVGDRHLFCDFHQARHVSVALSHLP